MNVLIIVLEVLLIAWVTAFVFFSLNRKKEKNFLLYLFVGVVGALLTNLVLASIFTTAFHLVYFGIGAVAFVFVWFLTDRE